MFDFPAKVQLASKDGEALAAISSGKVLCLVVMVEQSFEGVEEVLSAFQAHVGCIGEFQAIVCEEPDAQLMTLAFEQGVDQFFSKADYARDACAMVQQAMNLMTDETSAEFKTVALTRALRSGERAQIQSAEKAMGDLADYDFRAALAKGKVAEESGEYSRAVEIFAGASRLNKMFRPAAASLCESLLVTGRIDEALEVLHKLDRMNPYDVERKASIAAAYVEKEDFAKAEEYVQAANRLSPEHSRVLEVRAQILLCTGKVSEAFALLDLMSNVGPFFAAKINDLGIRLSQAGKGKSALTLYQKAHKIVRPSLRYKISMNAALACRRMGAWDLALEYLERCEQEYGGTFPKLAKIREAIIAGKADARDVSSRLE